MTDRNDSAKAKMDAERLFKDASTMKTAGTERRAVARGLAFLAIAFILWSVYFIYQSSFVASDGNRYFSLFDDAMITMRYAWNLSHGNGLVWNPGEPVEGYTNLLMALLMAPWTGILDKVGAVLAVQLSGIPVLLGLAALGLLHWHELARAGEVTHRHGFGALVFMGILVYYPLAYWTLMGMETGLLTLLLLGGSLLCLVYLRSGQNLVLLGSALALGLGYLARPDSAILATLMLGAASMLGPGTKRERLMRILLAMTTYAVLPLFQMAFRASYYGTLVPVTYILKLTGMPALIRIENGWGFTLPFIRQTRWLYLLGAVGALVGFSGRKAILLWPPVALLAYQIIIGGDGWDYWRLLAPGVPYLVILSLVAVDRALAAVARLGGANLVALSNTLMPFKAPFTVGVHRVFSVPTAAYLAGMVLVLMAALADYVWKGDPGFGYAQRYLLALGVLVIFLGGITHRRPLAHIVAFAVMLFMLIGVNLKFRDEAILLTVPYMVLDNKRNVNTALGISEMTSRDASVGVFWAGTIPYYTSRYAVDFLGKNDPYIAALPADISGAVAWAGMSSVPGHNKYDLMYSILERRPTYAQDLRWGAQDLSELLKDLYIEIDFPGDNLHFLRGDQAVLWERIPADQFVTE